MDSLAPRLPERGAILSFHRIRHGSWSQWLRKLPLSSSLTSPAPSPLSLSLPLLPSPPPSFFPPPLLYFLSLSAETLGSSQTLTQAANQKVAHSSCSCPTPPVRDVRASHGLMGIWAQGHQQCYSPAFFLRLLLLVSLPSPSPEPSCPLPTRPGSRICLISPMSPHLHSWPTLPCLGSWVKHLTSDKQLLLTAPASGCL